MYASSCATRVTPPTHVDPVTGLSVEQPAYLRPIDRLADRWHTVAIDYPGFGLSDPLPESPTFDRLAEITASVIDALGIGDYAVYMFDFGAPVGFRIALRHDTRVRAIITENANAYTDGFGPGVSALADWWADRDAGQQAVDEFVSLAGTQLQWQAGARTRTRQSRHAHDDQWILDLPGRASHESAAVDYQNNPPRYPDWQAWLRQRQPALLAIWEHDPFFVPAGAHAYARDIPTATIELLDTGHFALEEEADTIAAAVDNVMTTTFSGQRQ